MIHQDIQDFLASSACVGFVRFHKSDFEAAVNADIALQQMQHPTSFHYNPEHAHELTKMGVFSTTEAELAALHH